MKQLEVVPPRDAEIRDAVEQAALSISETMAHIESCVGKVIAAGRKLWAKRESLEHGQWMAWVEGQITEPFRVAYATVRNWIKLAEFAQRRSAELESAQTVRQAYQLAGILPEPEASTGSSTKAANYLVHVDRLERSITAAMQARPLAQWTKDERIALRTRLQRVIDICEKIDAA